MQLFHLISRIDRHALLYTTVIIGNHLDEMSNFKTKNVALKSKIFEHLMRLLAEHFFSLNFIESLIIQH